MNLLRPIELNFREGEKIKISPLGEVVGVDGRHYKIDADEVIKNTQDNSIDLVLDVNHGFSTEGELAAGWIDIKSLEKREDGIYASINTTDIGKEHIEKKFYRYLSPAYVMDRNKGDRSVLALDSVALVNKPNVLDKALNKKTNEEGDHMTQDEITKLQNDNKALSDELVAVKEENKKLNDKLVEINNTVKTQKVETAIKTGELMPNKKDFALTLEGNALDTFLELNKADSAHLGKDTNQDRENNSTPTDADKEVNRQLGLED